MANVLTEVVPQLLTQGLLVLKEAAWMPRLVNRAWENVAGQKGSTVTITVPPEVGVQDVIPGPTPPVTAGIEPGVVSLTVDKWKEAPFYLTDKEQTEVQAGLIPMTARQAVNSLARQVNTDILLNYKKFYGTAGTAGTTPFSVDLSEATEARKMLNIQLAPEEGRRLIIDPEAEANALQLRAIQDQSWRSNPSAIITGKIAQTLGFDWFMHTAVPTHTAGTLTGTITVLGTGSGNASPVPIGTKQVTLVSGGGEAVALVEGDILTFAGSTQTYVVTEDLTVGASANGIVKIYPGLKTAVAADALVSVLASHTANLAFAPQAIAFVTKPLESGPDGLGSVVQSVVDPDSGLSLRLEVTRQHKQVRWSFDILYGTAVLQPELGVRLLG
jgi:hypothetical protein